MKPKLIQLYETSTGTPVKTLAEWKHIEITNILKSGPSATIASEDYARTVIDNSDEIIAILSVPEKIGRPPGSKNRKPSVKQTPKPTVVEAA